MDPRASSEGTDGLAEARARLVEGLRVSGRAGAPVREAFLAVPRHVFLPPDSVAQAYEDTSAPNDKARIRRVRIVRDYGKYDRREAPQYYVDAKGGETLHA